MFNIELFNQAGIYWKAQGSSISIPGTSGRFQILKNHINIVSSLENGRLSIAGIIKMRATISEKNIQIHSKSATFYIEDGIMELNNGNITVIGNISLLK